MELPDTSFSALYGLPNMTTKTEKSGLEHWYDKVYDVPFSRFSVEDFARSCRQHLFPEHIVPRVLAILQDNPTAGELYDGELFDSLGSLPLHFWQQNPHYRKNAIEIFEMQHKFLSDNLDEEYLFRIHKFVSDIKIVERWKC